MTRKFLPAKTLREMVLRARGDAAEYALLDVREECDFADSHLLVASNVALSRLELRIRDLVPGLSTQVVLCDAGEGLAERADDVLRSLGYTNVLVLDGGIDAAQLAGFGLFSGINVPSKAFGELVETVAGTPHIGAKDLKASLDRRDDLVLLDVRPAEEYFQMSIPGALNIPGGELVYRVHDLVPNEHVPIVLNCAGRTRSIIGTQSLRNAGMRNPVYALRNGTMGWHLAGFKLEHGRSSVLRNVSAAGLAKARAAAERVATLAKVRSIGTATLDKWQNEPSRNLFVFDVRTRDEFEAGHLRGSRWVQGVQLVQETDRYVGVRNCRIVVIDDSDVRATMAASWLLQMGWPEVTTLRLDKCGDRLVKGPAKGEIPNVSAATRISPHQLDLARRSRKTMVIDLALSPDFLKGHIPGAHFVIRSRLPGLVPELATAEKVVLTSEDGLLADLAQLQLVALGLSNVMSLEGGTAAWQRTGLPMESGWPASAPSPGDVWIEPYDYESPDEAKREMQRYLDWEVGLTDQVRADASIPYDVRLPHP
jgi:rhodanese-related sulfurtransferase